MVADPATLKSPGAQPTQLHELDLALDLPNQLTQRRETDLALDLLNQPTDDFKPHAAETFV